MGGLSDVGDIAGLVGSIVGLAIAAIVLLTFAPVIAGDINGIALQSQDTCRLSNGELVDRVTPVQASTVTDSADEVWAENTTHLPLADSSGECTFSGTVTAAADSFVYTPKGTRLTITVADTFPTAAGAWDTASRSLTSLAGGSLVSLLFGAMAILLPAGALGFLGYFGAQIVKAQIGGGTLAVAIGATVAVVIIGSILPSIFAPLDALFVALDGNRYFVYSSGIGQLGGVLGNFLGISLIGGLITLGVMLWQGREGSSRGTQGMM